MGGSGRTSMVLVAVALFTATCGSGSESRLTEASPDWAAEAVDRVDAMEIAYDAEDVYSTALFYTAGGTLDLTVWNQGVQVTPGGVVEALRRMWFLSGNRADVRAEHVFVSLDGAIVWWHAFDRTGSEHWAQTYAFVANRTASRAYLGLERPFGSSTPDEKEIVALLADYVAAWSAGDAESLASVYARGATVTDAVRATTFSGVDEMELADPRPIDVGPWPEVFLYRNGDQAEAVVVVQLDGECPMLEARRWVLVDDVITHETRYVHVPSGRRCLPDPPDGWWTSHEPLEGFEDNVTKIVDVSGVVVQLVNAQPIQERFARWLTGRFVHSGLPLTDLAAIWFPPSPDCEGPRGLAYHSDERFGGSTVVLCDGADDLASERTATGWSKVATAVGFHELAHIWMRHHLDDETRAAFMERLGLAEWRNVDLLPGRSGVEHAADTIAWGLGGTGSAMYLKYPRPACAELTARFELLTGRQPLTECAVHEGPQ